MLKYIHCVLIPSFVIDLNSEVHGKIDPDVAGGPHPCGPRQLEVVIKLIEPINKIGEWIQMIGALAPDPEYPANFAKVFSRRHHN